MPFTVSPAPIMITVAAAAESAFFHHCVLNPEAPQPMENLTLYLPGCRSSSE
jgi:hypothetical protein